VTQNRLVVAKVGGSLLDWPDLSGRLRNWLERETTRGSPPVLLAGGGAVADVVRWLDATHDLDPDRAHWIAVHALDLAAHLLEALVPGLALVTGFDEIDAALSSGKIPVVAPTLFLLDDDADPDALPHNWSVTSDSIAARLAVLLDADELVLLKSVTPPPDLDRASAARRGLVDPEFPRASARLDTVRILNLRDTSDPPATLLPHPRS
jgi:aspartokinase-like uncharacterized kinase